MIFVLDEDVSRHIARALRREGHHIVCVSELAPSISDEAVLDMANEKGALLVTADKDFGELIFRQGRAAVGVVLLRLARLSQPTRAAIVAAAVQEHGLQLKGAFTVVTPGLVRIRRNT